MLRHVGRPISLLLSRGHRENRLTACKHLPVTRTLHYEGTDDDYMPALHRKQNDQQKWGYISADDVSLRQIKLRVDGTPSLTSKHPFYGKTITYQVCMLRRWSYRPALRVTRAFEVAGRHLTDGFLTISATLRQKARWKQTANCSLKINFPVVTLYSLSGKSYTDFSYGYARQVQYKIML